MITPIALGELIRYTLPWDKENSTIWLLGPLDSITKSRIIGDSLKFDTTDINNPKITPNLKPFEQDILILKMGLKGFENFKLHDKNVELKTEKKKLFGVEVELVHDDIIKMIPQRVIHQLANEIWAENVVVEEEEKNS